MTLQAASGVIVTESGDEESNTVNFCCNALDRVADGPRRSKNRNEEKSLQLQINTLIEKQKNDDVKIQKLSNELSYIKNAELSKKDEIDKEEEETLDTDTFSIMMTSKVRSTGWALGIATFALQMVLMIMILFGDSFDQLFRSEGTDSLIPISVSNKVRAGQFITIILSLFVQRDVLSAIKYFIIFRDSSQNGLWQILLVDDKEETKSKEEEDSKSGAKQKLMWFWRAIFPNILKSVQGLLVLIASLVIIVHSSSLLDLLKDFTALYFVSEIDNIVFYVTDQRYFGDALNKRAEKVKNIKVQDVSEDEASLSCFSCYGRRGIRRIRGLVLFIIFAAIFSYWVYIVHGQVTGKFFREKFPKCNVEDQAEISNLGNGECNDGFLNQISCGFDGGDCIDFNKDYPTCEADEDAYIVGDGECNEKYNNPECLFDGGDCCRFNTITTQDNNGFCNGGLHNTKACNYDGGECLDFNVKYRKCPIETLALEVDPGKSVIIGDKVCDSGVYMSEICGYEGGDCKECETNLRATNLPKGAERLIGDGFCNGKDFMGNGCNNDGGDCDECVTILNDTTTNGIIYPNPELLVGDGFCNGGIFHAEACGNDGEDCSKTCSSIPSSNAATLALYAADINGDGFADLVVGDYFKQSNILLITIVNGNVVSFEDPINLPGTYTSTRSILVADVNGDGKLDIIIGNSRSTTNQLLLNTGTKEKPSFPEPIDLPGGEHYTWSIVAADVNGDNYNDLIIGNYGQSNQLLLNNSTNEVVSFQTPIILPGGEEVKTTSIVVTDANKDGKLDIIVGNREHPNQLLINDGTIKDGNETIVSFKDPTNLPGDDYDCYSIVAADVNNDEYEDLIIGNERGPNQLFMHSNSANEKIFEEPINLPGVVTTTRQIVAADVNGDDRIDLVIGNSNTNDPNQILINTGSEDIFNSAVDLPCSNDMYTYALAVADINSDGRPDFIFGNAGDGDSEQKNQLLLNLGDGKSVREPGGPGSSWLPDGG